MEWLKFVDFEAYCKTCRYEKQNETKEPCNECLRSPMRKNSVKPVEWKEKVKNTE